MEPIAPHLQVHIFTAHTDGCPRHPRTIVRLLDVITSELHNDRAIVKVLNRCNDIRIGAPSISRQAMKSIDYEYRNLYS